MFTRGVCPNAKHTVTYVCPNAKHTVTYVCPNAIHTVTYVCPNAIGVNALMVCMKDSLY